MKYLRLLIFAFLPALTMPMVGYAADSDTAAAAAVDAATVPSVKVVRGAVEIDNPTDTTVDVDIYAITGASVKHTGIDAGEHMRIELPAGTYIVKVGRLAKRVAVG